MIYKYYTRLVLIGIGAWVVFSIMVLSTLALAEESVCAPRKDIVTHLNKHQEVVVGRGTTLSGQIMIEVFASPVDDLTFTMLTTDLTGNSCIQFYGWSWISVGPRSGELKALRREE